MKTEQKLTGWLREKCHFQAGASVTHSGHFDRPLRPTPQKNEMKSPTIQKEHPPGNLEAATLPKEQGSLPHDAFVSAEVHIFI